jgi:hypothetical protein
VRGVELEEEKERCPRPLTGLTPRAKKRKERGDDECDGDGNDDDGNDDDGGNDDSDDVDDGDVNDVDVRVDDDDDEKSENGHRPTFLIMLRPTCQCPSSL